VTYQSLSSAEENANQLSVQSAAAIAVYSMDKAMDSYYGNLGSSPTEICTSHWWHRQKHLAKIAPILH